MGIICKLHWRSILYRSNWSAINHFTLGVEHREYFTFSLFLWNPIYRSLFFIRLVVNNNIYRLLLHKRGRKEYSESSSNCLIFNRCFKRDIFVIKIGDSLDLHSLIVQHNIIEIINLWNHGNDVKAFDLLVVKVNLKIKIHVRCLNLIHVRIWCIIIVVCSSPYCNNKTD